MPEWLILLSVKVKDFDTRRELAREIGIEGPTLTHHLDSMERDGLVKRTREPDNRRAIRVELTAKGEQMSEHLREAAKTYDRQIRLGISPDDVDRVRELLTRIAENVSR